MDEKKKNEDVTTDMNNQGSKGGSATEIQDLDALDYLDESDYGDMTENGQT